MDTSEKDQLVVHNEKDVKKYYDNIYFSFFFIACLFNSYYCYVFLDNYLLDSYALRQTQTAITAWYFVKNGFKLAYETPIAGAPWSIPFEFPLYQWLVATVKHTLPNISLDIIGRVVSLSFFYLAIVYLYKISLLYTKNNFQSLFILSFILLHPIYIFWSRTFMIESTALFFSLFYTYYGLTCLQNKKYLYLTLAFLGGLLAGLVKITTFLPFLIFLFAAAARQWYVEEKFRFNPGTVIRYVLYGVLLFLIPIIVVKLWVDFADHLKSLNKYAAEFYSSTKLQAWNFGTLKQKLSAGAWLNIFRLSQVFHPFFYSLCIGLLVYAAIEKYKYWKHALVCLVFYLLAPLIFTNLHFVHEYYTYANSFSLCLSIAFVALSFIEQSNIKIRLAGMAFGIGVLVFFADRYLEGDYKKQTTDTKFLARMADFVKQNTNSDDVVLVYGTDCSAEYPYYMERRAIALRNTFTSVKDKAFTDLMEQNKQYNISTLVLATHRQLINPTFTKELIAYMGFRQVMQAGPVFVFKKIK